MAAEGDKRDIAARRQKSVEDHRERAIEVGAGLGGPEASHGRAPFYLLGGLRRRGSRKTQQLRRSPDVDSD